jgi:hypothetical protein
MLALNSGRCAVRELLTRKISAAPAVARAALVPSAMGASPCRRRLRPFSLLKPHPVEHSDSRDPRGAWRHRAD